MGISAVESRQMALDGRPQDRRLARRRLRTLSPSPPAGPLGPHGAIREWLVLGPVAWDEDTQPSKNDLLPNESDLAPDEGQQTGGFVWKKVAVETACLEPRSLFNTDKVCAGGEYESRNIRWATLLPEWSIASPIIVGPRVFVQAEERTLCCVDKNDGRILGMRTTTFCDAATPADRQAHPEVFRTVEPLAARLREIDAAPSTSPRQSKEKLKLEEQINRLMSKVDPEQYNAGLRPGEPGTSAPTPTSDGRYVYVNFHPCIAACFDLDGNRRWTSVHPVLFPDEHGRVSSPHLVDGKLLVHADQLVALDTASGKPLWQMPREYFIGQEERPRQEKQYVWEQGYLYRSSLVDLVLGGQRLVVTPVNVLRADDGHVLCSMSEENTKYIPTPVVDGRRMFRLMTAKYNSYGYTYLDTFELPPEPAEPFAMKRLARVTVDTVRFPRNAYGDYFASPLYHEGLVYCLNADGVLSVVDVEKHEVTYQKLLDLDWMVGPGPARGGCGASPALAGNYIY